MNHMGKRCLISLILALIMMLGITSALAASGTVNVASLVLREETSTKSDAVQTLKKGEELDIIYKDGSWYKVKYGRYTGFVMSRYIKTSDTIPTRDEVEGVQMGSQGTTVKNVQKRLKELGYLTGSADGAFGKKTEEAVKAFQKRNGLTADGVVGEKTMNVLMSSAAKKAESASSGSAPSTPAPEKEDTTLREGSRGTEVKKLQQRLKDLRYYKGSVDGVYGSGTIKAVKAFQQKNGLTVDGVAGSSTQSKVYSSSAKKADEEAAKEEDKEETQDDETLRQGSKGQAVKTLQEKLKRLGYYKGSVDGVYGSGTIAAVKAFQTRNKLTVDGVAGTSTLKVLYSSSAKEAEDEDEEVSEELRAGSYGPEVRTLQKRLKELGYYKNSIDGSYGSLTVAAVKAFQKRNGLTVDGVAGGSTLTKLNSSSAKAAADADKEEEKEEDKDTSDSKDDGVLRPGDKGTEVKELQYRLRELGYYSGSRDGVYGSGTRTAVMAFQTRNSLAVDGIAGPATLKKVYSSSAIKAGSTSSSTGSSSGSSSSGSTSSGSSAAAEALKTNQKLNPGDSGTQVRALQARLKELGYYTSTIDGEYGYGTRQAVIAFQKNNGLTQDGIAGEATLKKMVSSSAVKKDDVQAGTYVTERLDWFNGGASRIPRGAIFQVKDVKTGLVFTAKRQAGGYHLDAEPLTAADTATLKKINGGEFTYHRRPMLVLYNGRVYACSIYSEPHGSDTIASNNFDGQFCLHFYGSKTHGTDRVDPDHKKCEEQALKATW
ncbi:MAG: peptidoglycan-binding protein [Clostridia bacterium]|nr:peptidoglycan-binding protein [Clostridia bacterium]